MIFLVVVWLLTAISNKCSQNHWFDSEIDLTPGYVAAYPLPLMTSAFYNGFSARQPSLVQPEWFQLNRTRFRKSYKGSPKMRIITRTLLILLLSAVTVACAKPQDQKPPDEVTVQLKWFHQAQFAGFYVAQEKGYYAAENLKVNFLEGGQDIDITMPVILRQADFAVVAPENIFKKRSQGAPITAIASLYRRSAVVFVSMADSGIVGPADFAGKIIAIGGIGAATQDLQFQFYAMMTKLELDVGRVKIVPYDPEYTDFYSGRVDVTPAFITGGVIKMRRKGYKLNLIWPGDYGVRFYSDTLVANEQMIAQKPKLVERFLRATLKGWREAVGDPESAVAATMKYARVKDAGLQMAMVEALLPLVHTGEDKIGWMKAERWQEMHRILREQRIISVPLPDVSQVYTMQFLEAIYGGNTQ
jgi:NitT/TauT family transport system substrate-binding protein